MKRFILAIVLLIGSGPLVADYPLEIIQLNNRPVAEIIPLLRPFIVPDGSIAGMNDQLIIRTSPDNLAEIRRILQRLDQRPRNLRISVRQSAGGRYSQRSIQADVDTMLGKHAKVVVGNPRGGGNRLRIQEARTESDLDATHTLRVLEGRPAFIATGESVPITEQTTIINDDTVHQQLTTRYQDVTSGFYVVPRINGSMVTLEIGPHMARPGSPQTGHKSSYQIQQAHSVVSGRLGEWITLGGVTRSAVGEDRTILKQARTTSGDDRLIELLVEEISP